VLSPILSLAVRDSRLVRNPADGIGLPREIQQDRRFLSHSEVKQLAAAAGEYEIVILFLAYTGLRFGEMAALRVDRVDLERLQVEVAESVTAVNVVLPWGTPKGHTRRRVAVPRFVADALAAHITGKRPSDLVFTSPIGAVLRASNFRRDTWNGAITAVGLGDMVRTASGPLRPRWPSPPAPTSRSSSSCSGTSRQR
jgi:integrase